jgi:hypothetical protein
MKAQRERKTPEVKRVSRKARRMTPAVLLKDGKQAFVVLDIRDYRDILDKLDDLEDIQYVDKLSKRPRNTGPFEEFLAERRQIGIHR